MATITTRDGVTLFYRDWGAGAPVILTHGWPQSGESWEVQALHLALNGFRVLTPDRRGHGRSGESWTGNDLDHDADDLADLIAALDLEDVALVGFSAGGGAVARYVGRHGTGRIARLGLVAAITPLMLKTAANPLGTPRSVFDALRAASLSDRAQLYRDLASGPFFGFNRPGATVSHGAIDAFCRQALQASPKAALDGIRAFSETDLTPDLRRFDRPTLIIHGDDDQIVPIDAAGRAAARLVPRAEFRVYECAPHGLPFTHQAMLNADLLAFLGGGEALPAAASISDRHQSAHQV